MTDGKVIWRYVVEFISLIGIILCKKIPQKGGEGIELYEIFLYVNAIKLV